MEKRRGPKTRRVDVRVDEQTDALLDQLAEEMMASRSYVLRLAVHEMALARARAKTLRAQERD
jgi:predicted transcriptional regulator